MTETKDYAMAAALACAMAGASDCERAVKRSCVLVEMKDYEMAAELACAMVEASSQALVETKAYWIASTLACEKADV